MNQQYKLQSSTLKPHEPKAVNLMSDSANNYLRQEAMAEILKIRHKEQRASQDRDGYTGAGTGKQVRDQEWEQDWEHNSQVGQRHMGKTSR